MTEKRFSIAVDGPAGSGKSTAAKRAAKALHIIYIDTGAMYRTVALHCMKEGISVEKEEAVVASLEKLRMEICPTEEGQSIFLNGEDVTAKLRTTEIGQGASAVASYEKVREYLVELQRKLAETHSVIMDGRDIGTVVLPHAEVKIYLDAGVEERAKRRLGELEAQGKTDTLENIKEMIAKRDEADMNRKHSPLRKAEDAVFLDSTGLDIEAVTKKILEIVQEKIK